jgi:uncharacterized RDD family membrane protein YckC
MTDSQATNPYAAPQTTDHLAAIPQGLPLASRWARLGAVLIDGIVQMVVIVPVLLLAFGGWSNYLAKAETMGLVMTAVLQLGSFIVFLLIHGYLMKTRGQTIGKLALGIKMVRSNENPADLQRLALMRYLPQYAITAIPLVGGLFYIVDVLFIFRESRKCLHDDIADTIVVKVQPAR